MQTIGIIGGGQLGSMMIDAGKKNQSYRFVVLDTNTNVCAYPKADVFIEGAYDDPLLLEQLFVQSDFITYEFENIPAHTLEQIQRITKKTLTPSVRLLDISQHRIKEKTTLQHLGLLTAPFQAINTKQDLQKDNWAIKFPCILKTCQGGYDGKNQWTINDLKALHAIQIEENREYILEQKIPFSKEVSCIGFRNADGHFQHLPVVENMHHNGILNISIAPARIDDNLNEQIVAMTKKVMTELNVCGTLAIEFFITQDNQILINEIAPRPHNSGHFSLDGCNYSQFDMHLKAITNQSLPEVKMQHATVMLNVLGQHATHVEQTTWNDYTIFHWYGKHENRHNRKIGHINFCGQDIALLLKKAIEFYTL